MYNIGTENKPSGSITLSEASHKTGVPASTIKRWLQGSLIKYECVGEGQGTRYKVAEGDLVAFLQTDDAGKYRIKPAMPGSVTQPADSAPLRTATVLGVDEHSVPLKFILLDPDCQIRARLDECVVNEYADAMREGVQFPPVLLFHDEQQNRYYIGDGYHRVSACKLAGLDQVSAIVSIGNKTAAIRCALQANASHGLRRTSADKRRAIHIALQQYPHLSNVEIAKLCAVSESSVRNYREAPAPDAKRIGADGKRQAAKKQKPSSYKRAKSAITRLRCTADDAAKLIGWLITHYKIDYGQNDNP